MWFYEMQQIIKSICEKPGSPQTTDLKKWLGRTMTPFKETTEMVEPLIPNSRTTEPNGRTIPFQE